MPNYFAPVGDTAAPPFSLGTVGPNGNRPDAAGEFADIVQGGRPWAGGEGYGVVGGAPLGDAYRTQIAALRRRYALQPTTFGKLRAATRRALGR